MKIFSILTAMLTSSIMVLAQPAMAQPKGEPVALDTVSGQLHGTLEVPEGALPHPLVIIIAGSGPTNRDGNFGLRDGNNNSLKLLAAGLAEHGIASLRFDKRGIAESAKAGPKEADLRFETYIDDTVLWGQKFQGDVRFSSLIVLGHSEGSLIGMVAAKKLGADAYISVAGAGRDASDILLGQLRPQLPPDLMKRSEEIIETVRQGKTTTDVPTVLNVLFRPSVQPYLTSWFHYNPAKKIDELTMPILILQGTTDIQVGIEDAMSLYKAKPTSKLVIIEGMNHVLKMVSNDRTLQLKSYSDPDLPISSQLIVEVSQFIHSLPKE